MDALIHAGFQCRGFSGSLERLYHGVNLDKVKPLEKKYFEQLLNNALGFPHADVMSCWTCKKTGALLVCSRCKDASYCSQTCQRADWKGHKKVCSRAKATKLLNTES